MDVTRKLRVYISGPITKGNRNWNFFQAAETERQLMLEGFAPLNPMRSMIMPFAWQDDFPHHLWLAVDLPWVECADAFLRMPGDSIGAEEEMRHAQEFNIPVFTDIDDLKEWRTHCLLEAERMVQ